MNLLIDAFISYFLIATNLVIIYNGYFCLFDASTYTENILVQLSPIIETWFFLNLINTIFLLMSYFFNFIAEAFTFRIAITWIFCRLLLIVWQIMGSWNKYKTHAVKNKNILERESLLFLGELRIYAPYSNDIIDWKQFMQWQQQKILINKNLRGWGQTKKCPWAHLGKIDKKINKEIIIILFFFLYLNKFFFK